MCPKLKSYPRDTLRQYKKEQMTSTDRMCDEQEGYGYKKVRKVFMEKSFELWAWRTQWRQTKKLPRNWKSEYS